MNSDNPQAQKLVLASSSRYRRALLERLGLKFTACSPDVDESRFEHESVVQTTQRLAQLKADAAQQQYARACIIGSDQLCATTNAAGDDIILGKPGTREAAIDQLATLSGREVQFHTAVVVLSGNQAHCASDVTRVRFRQLSTGDITRYLDAEPEAVYCAGSFMSEALGISLCDAIISSDPTALIGLPLIATAGLLRETGYAVP